MILKRNPATDGKPEIPALSADAEYAPAAALLALLNAKHDALSNRITLLTLDNYLSSRPVDSKSTADADLRSRRQWLRVELAVADIGPKGAGVEGQHPAIVAALAVLKGDHVDPPDTVTEQISRAERDRAVIDCALRVQREVVTEIAERKAHELAQRLADFNSSLLLTAYRAAQELAHATSAVQQFHVEFFRLGYGHPRSDVLPAILTRGGQLLGRETDWNSDIAVTRRALESRGIV